ncbi:MAG: STT3 domain-containing protein [Nanoarchaeota archaeon]|nr:STT3 domain-containing protein [Nanoarchaeota archaeon]
MSEEKKHPDEEVIDFSKIKNKITGLFDKKKSEQAKHASRDAKPAADDSLSIDYQQIKGAAKKHARWLIPLVCILIAVFVSVYLRTMPQRMPVADEWAGNTVTNYYQGLIQEQINQQYPYLPDQNKQSLIEKEWQNFQKQNKENLAAQTKTLSQQYLEQFKDEEGTLYLLGIDPYYYYQQTEYVLENGFPGTRIDEEGMIWDDYRLAPLGREGYWNFHSWFGAVWHKFLNLFGDFSLMYTFFFVGTIFSALTVIPGFFIGRKLTNNNVGGFFTAFLLAVASFFVARTTGESSDTDVYSVFFPVLITWLFLEALDAQEKRWKIIWISLAGLATGLFAFAWTGWWYIALFILATMLFQIGYSLLSQWKQLDSALKSKEVKESGALLGGYALLIAVFVIIFTGVTDFMRLLSGPFKFINLKAVAVDSYWPNIKTTVAELNVVSLQNVIATLGGKLLLLLAIVGIMILLLRKNAHGKREPHLGFLLALWLAASLFATTKGVRFILQATPIFAIAVGTCLGLFWYYASQWISKELKINQNITKVTVFLLLALLLISPAKAGYSQAHNSVPSMNDGWYDTLIKIKEEAPENIIITSWWDFGHWFKAIASRPVTFDGGTQTSWGAYWVGRSLLANDERSTAGIVRMLNCGQNAAFDELNKVFNDTPKSIQLLNEMVVLEKDAALQKSEQAGLTGPQATAVVKYTHCDNPPEDYYITSEDMIGKAGVWGHFGSWDFTRAVMYQKVKKLEKNEAISTLIDEFGLTEEQADQYYAEITSNEADRWISPWPGYINGMQPCETVSESMLHCVGSLQGKGFIINIDLADHSAKFESQNEIYPNSMVYPTPDGVMEKKFSDSGTTSGFSIVLIPNGSDYALLPTDPLQANSMFTKLYFLNGHGQSCFSKFDEAKNINGGKIVTWKVDYDCGQKNEVFFTEQD